MGLPPLMPAALSLLFMEEAAETLFLQLAETRTGWHAFTAEVARRYPDIAARSRAVLARVVAMVTGCRAGTMHIWRPTTPEACLGAALLDLTPAGVTADAALPGGRCKSGHVRRCDFHIASSHHEERFEVAGLVDRAGTPRTFHGVRYIARTMPERCEAYVALGLPPPITLYADEVLDRARLLPIVAEVVARVAGTAVSRNV